MKASVDFQITSPLKSGLTKKSGLNELFLRETYSKNQAYRLIICSPWLEVEPFELIVPLLDPDVRHELYILTFKDHQSFHFQGIKTYLEGLYKKPFHTIVLGQLPAENNPKKLRSDILHAKIFLLTKTINSKGPDLNDIPEIIEAYFGSANFTMNGTGHGATLHSSNQKFEIVARINPDDKPGKRCLYEAFLSIWFNCDENRFNGKWETFYQYPKKNPKKK